MVILMAKKPLVFVLSGFGLNCEMETARAVELAGGEARIVHLSRLANGSTKLEEAQGFIVPGGWSFGDNIAAGAVLANKMRHSLREQLDEFRVAKKPIMGICNGFQVLTKLGLVPDLAGKLSQEASLSANKQGRFENRWVYLRVEESACKLLSGIKWVYAPVRHGEGQFVPKDNETLNAMRKEGLVALRYVNEKLESGAGYPYNPNGAADDIAGICNKEGNVLCFMPHPECNVRRTQHPRWTRGENANEGSGLQIYSGFVKHAVKFV